MKKVFIICAAILMVPFLSSAHGGIPDGHPNVPLTKKNYAHIGGLAVLSIALIGYSVWEARRSWKNRK